MPQRGLVRALQGPSEVVQQGYPLRAGWWYSPFNRTGTGNLGASMANDNNNVFGGFVSLRYPIAFDALLCVVAGANAGAGAVVRLGAYQLPLAERLLARRDAPVADVPSTLFAGASLLVDAGTASLNTTGDKLITHQRVVAYPPGILLVAAPQNLDTGGARPSFDVASCDSEAWIFGHYQTGTDNRRAPSFMFRNNDFSTPSYSGPLPQRAPFGVANHQGVNQSLPFIRMRAAA